MVRFPEYPTENHLTVKDRTTGGFTRNRLVGASASARQLKLLEGRTIYENSDTHERWRTYAQAGTIGSEVSPD